MQQMQAQHSPSRSLPYLQGIEVADSAYAAVQLSIEIPSTKIEDFFSLDLSIKPTSRTRDDPEALHHGSFPPASL